MSIFTIDTNKQSHNNIQISKNSFNHITHYDECVYEVSLTGAVNFTQSCRYKTEALHGAQPSVDIMIDNIMVEK